MKNNRWWVCGLVAGVAAAVIGCAAVAAGVWVLGAPPELHQVVNRVFATATSTATASPTPTVTATPSPTTTPTVTPVLLDAPSPSATATPRPAPPTPTAAPPPTSTRRPKPPAQAAASPIPASPTAAETTPIAPAATPTPQAQPFLPIGSRAVLSPQSNGVVGTAVLFSGREFTMINFSYDGQCPAADIRVGKKGFPKPPIAVLTYLEARPYKDESLAVPIAPDVPANSADAIFVYCDTRDEMMAWGEIAPPR